MNITAKFSIPADRLADVPLTVGITMTRKQWKQFATELREHGKSDQAATLEAIVRQVLGQFDALEERSFDVGRYFCKASEED